mmetsp:Transcript_3286/g.7730  ORF Transcript_3286/g.7730 Transcript_3286/m.7730 type:complete len:272 (+) Transcript_3286:875-1690(+)
MRDFQLLTQLSYVVCFLIVHTSLYGAIASINKAAASCPFQRINVAPEFQASSRLQSFFFSDGRLFNPMSDRYRVEAISAGWQGVVGKAWDVTKQERVAIKKLKLFERTSRLLKSTRELILMRLLASSGDFVQVKTAFLGGQPGSPEALYIVMDLHPMTGEEVPPTPQGPPCGRSQSPVPPRSRCRPGRRQALANKQHPPPPIPSLLPPPEHDSRSGPTAPPDRRGAGDGVERPSATAVADSAQNWGRNPGPLAASELLPSADACDGKLRRV